MRCCAVAARVGVVGLEAGGLWSEGGRDQGGKGHTLSRHEERLAAS